MKITESSKQQFLNDLALKNLFWSYNREMMSSLPDQIIIEHVLIYGDTDDIIFLFKLFSYRFIKKIWTERVIPDQRFRNVNYYLGRVFFNIKDIEGYITKYSQLNSRYERIKQLAAQME